MAVKQEIATRSVFPGVPLAPPSERVALKRFLQGNPQAPTGVTRGGDGVQVGSNDLTFLDVVAAVVLADNNFFRPVQRRRRVSDAQVRDMAQQQDAALSNGSVLSAQSHAKPNESPKRHRTHSTFLNDNEREEVQLHKQSKQTRAGRREKRRGTVTPEHTGLHTEMHPSAAKALKGDQIKNIEDVIDFDTPPPYTALFSIWVHTAIQNRITGRRTSYRDFQGLPIRSPYLRHIHQFRPEDFRQYKKLVRSIVGKAERSLKKDTKGKEVEFFCEVPLLATPKQDEAADFINKKLRGKRLSKHTVLQYIANPTDFEHESLRNVSKLDPEVREKLRLIRTWSFDAKRGRFIRPKTRLDIVKIAWAKTEANRDVGELVNALRPITHKYLFNFDSWVGKKIIFQGVEMTALDGMRLLLNKVASGDVELSIFDIKGNMNSKSTVDSSSRKKKMHVAQADEMKYSHIKDAVAAALPVIQFASKIIDHPATLREVIRRSRLGHIEYDMVISQNAAQPGRPQLFELTVPDAKDVRVVPYIIHGGSILRNLDRRSFHVTSWGKQVTEERRMRTREYRRRARRRTANRPSNRKPETNTSKRTVGTTVRAEGQERREAVATGMGGNETVLFEQNGAQTGNGSNGTGEDSTSSRMARARAVLHETRRTRGEGNGGNTNGEHNGEGHPQLVEKPIDIARRAVGLLNGFLKSVSQQGADLAFSSVVFIPIFAEVIEKRQQHGRPTLNYATLFAETRIYLDERIRHENAGGGNTQELSFALSALNERIAFILEQKKEIRVRFPSLDSKNASNDKAQTDNPPSGQDSQI